ncbi:hypothetical protein [Acetobacter cibinongensis]|uniref:Mu-like prophage FluMu N-terminal domain-containing protein n=1 Tax=Acetobacter cibinongensis TaxID=146475 RepID=A0A1Z5YR53_9PROT|nr:hypothetical protein [Acetobacter cibinongensis]OUI98097.1 hypothetical protein HK14_01095 [Acetobacter cibinongensis]
MAPRKNTPMTAAETVETVDVQEPQAVLADHGASDLPDALVEETTGEGVLVHPHDELDAAQAKEDAQIAFGQGVLISSNGHKCVVLPGQIIVVCREPGFRRGGIEHPAMHVYRRHQLSKKQLEQMRAEPLLEIIEVG